MFGYLRKMAPFLLPEVPGSSAIKRGHAEFFQIERESNAEFLAFPRSVDGEKHFSAENRLQLAQLVADLKFKSLGVS
jgi:hypothetical protein